MLGANLGLLLYGEVSVMFFNRVTALDLCTKCVSPKYLQNKWLHIEFLLVLLSKFKMHTKNEHSGGVSW